MKKWIQKLSGALIASVLALTLSSKASADLQEDDPDPDQPLPQYEENLSEDDPDGDGSGEGEPGAEDGDPVEPGAEGGSALTYTAFSSDVDSGDGIVLSGANDPEGGPADTGDSGETGDTGDTGDTGSDTEPGTVSIGGTTFTPGEDAGIDLSGTTSDPDDLFGFDAGDPDDATDDSFYMVNYNGSGESLSSEDSDINIVAAGLNQLGSILADGNVNVTGTGILLVDQIQLAEGCGFYLHPIEGMYDSGSVAVFLLTSPADSQSGSNAVYTLLNPASAPGILDESYVIPTGIDLVMPSGTALVLNGMVVAENNETHERTYFYDSVPDSYKTSEYTLTVNEPSLTVSEGASLTVGSEASITMSSIWYGEDLSPEIEVFGRLTVDGEIGGQGAVYVGNTDSSSPAVLGGTGTISSDSLSIRYASRVDEQSNLLLASPNVNFAGCYENCITSINHLNIQDSNVSFGSGFTIGTINAEGDCMLSGYITSCGDISLSEGSTLSLNLVYSSTMTLNGSISGGTIRFICGSYIFAPGSSVSPGTLFTSMASPENSYGIIIYDYSDADVNSLFVSPDQGVPRILCPPDSETAPTSVPCSFMYREETDNVAVCSSVVTDTYSLSSGSYSFNYADLLALMGSDLANPWSNSEGMSGSSDITYDIYFAVHYADQDGTLHTVYLRGDGSVSLPEGAVPLAIDGFYCRSKFSVEPANEVFNTQTSATGSGIIGGSGAGSISGGTGLQINIPTGGGNNNGNNENGGDDPSPVIHPQPAPQQDVAVSVTELSASDPQAASLEELQPVYSLSATADGQVLTELSGSVTVRFSCPAPQTGGMIFAVFRAEDGSLKVFRARYDRISGQLVFQTDLLGDFAVVCIDYDGELYSDEFYALLESFDSVRSLR